MDNRRPAVHVAFYGSLLLLMTLIVSRHLGDLLPTAVARHVSNDSEGYVEALALGAWIAFVRPRLVGTRAGWPVALVVGLGCLALGTWLYDSHVLSTVRTLNETFLALGVLLPYLQARRPLRGAVAPCAALAVVVAAVLLERTGLGQATTHLAEGVVMIVLLPLAVDVFDRGVLDPLNENAWRTRAGCAGALVVLPLLSIGLRHLSLPTDVHLVIAYSVRAQEAYVGTLLLLVYSAALRRPRRGAGLPPTHETYAVA